MEHAAGRNWRSVIKYHLDRTLHLRTTQLGYSRMESYEQDTPHQTTEGRQTAIQSKSSSWLPLVSAPTAFPTFHKFTALPIELRLQIWELALFGTPRIVEFIEVLNIDSPAPYSLGRPRDFDHLLLSKQIPTSLQICQETRSFALSRYIFAIGNLKLYLDPKIDTLYFGKLASYSTLQILALCALEEDLGKLERLIIRDEFVDVLARPVRSRATFDVGPAFTFLSGLSDLIILFSKKEGHGKSTLGALCYDGHCSMCNKMKHWKGFHGWVLPTYKEFVRTKQVGIDDGLLEDEYRRVLEMSIIERRAWLRRYCRRVIWNVGERIVDPAVKIQACSVAELHRFINVKT
jgi:hypothetical protein